MPSVTPRQAANALVEVLELHQSLNNAAKGRIHQWCYGVTRSGECRTDIFADTESDDLKALCTAIRADAFGVLKFLQTSSGVWDRVDLDGIIACIAAKSRSRLF